MEVHFIDVGCGDMTLLLLPNGKTFLVDCNLTQVNSSSVMTYVKKVMGSRRVIDYFVNTHRDADHFRGVKLIHSSFPIQRIWDSGVVGTSPDSSEYREYMSLRRSVDCEEILPRKYWEFGDVTIRAMNSKWDDYSNPNDQSIVLKAEYKTPEDSVIITGDTSFKPWREKILPYYSENKLKCTILQASHHGSITFFDDPSDEKHYYTDHINKINPAMTIISVGPNSNGLPDAKAVELYEQYSRGSNKGNKVYSTENKGNIKVVFGDEGWNLKVNQ